MSLKRKLAKLKVGIRKHRRQSEEKKIKRIQLRTNKYKREEELYNRRNDERAAEIRARLAKEKAKAPTVAARKKKVQKARVASKKTASGLIKAIKAFNSYANKR
jgi:hypothetical protein